MKKTCKRCGFIPKTDDPFHRGIGAMSRTDNKTSICSDCGVAEAFEDFLKGSKLTPQSEWPIRKEEWN